MRNQVPSELYLSTLPPAAQDVCIILVVDCQHPGKFMPKSIFSEKHVAQHEFSHFSLQVRRRS